MILPHLCLLRVWGSGIWTSTRSYLYPYANLNSATVACTFGSSASNSETPLLRQAEQEQGTNRNFKLCVHLQSSRTQFARESMAFAAMSDRRLAPSPAVLALMLLILTSGSWGKTIPRRRLDDNTYSDGGSSSSGSSKGSSSSGSSSGSSKTSTSNSAVSRSSGDSSDSGGISYSKNLLASRIQAANTQGSVTGDPVLTAFDGQRFEFHGEADRFYDLVSEKGVFQVFPPRPSGHDGQRHALLCFDGMSFAAAAFLLSEFFQLMTEAERNLPFECRFRRS